jgi:hypothetical protein
VSQPQVQLAEEHRDRDRRGCEAPQRQPPPERPGLRDRKVRLGG